MFIENEELLNNNISEIASVNRMYYLCYLVCVVFADAIGVHLFWYVKTDWITIDPLFYFFSTLVPALIGYWMYVRSKESLKYRYFIIYSVMVFYAYVNFMGKDFLFGLYILPMLIAGIAYADVIFSIKMSVVALVIDFLGMMFSYFMTNDLQELNRKVYVFVLIAASVSFMNVCANMVAQRQGRRIAEVNKERDRFKAIVSVGVSSIFEYDVAQDIAMFASGSEGEYGNEVYVADFRASVKKNRYVPFADWYKFDEIVQEIVSGVDVLEKEMRVAFGDDDYKWFRIKVRAIRDNDGHCEKVIGAFEDINKEKLLEERKADEKMRDPLTRFYLKEYVGQKIDAYLNGEDSDKLSGLFIIDVDDYETLTESLGQAFGEEILKNISSDITGLFYDTDVFGRTGVSEFVVLMKNVETKRDIERKVKEIQRVIADTYVGESHSSKCTVSIGVAISPLDGDKYTTLFTNAEKALSLALSKGKNHYDVYNSAKENTYSSLSSDSAFRELKRQNEMGMNSHSVESLAELAFKLIDESKDTDSAINLLIRQVVRQMGLDAVVIKEKNSGDGLMRVMYQYGMDDDSVYGLNSAIEYSPKQWKNMVDSYKHSGGIRAIGSLQEAGGEEERHFMLAMGIESFVSCAFYDKGEFMGTLDFLDFGNERNWSGSDINAFKAMANVVSSYLLKMKAYETASETVERLTGYDAVTGLYKYEKFLSLLTDFIENAEHGNYAIIYNDVSNFKYFNEQYGYEQGDELLREIGEIFTTHEGVIYTSRVFSDNIVYLVNVGEIDEKQFKSELNKGVKVIVERLHKQYFDSRIDVCVGVCTFTISGAPVPIKDIISNANMARKKAKLPGMPKVVFYDEQMGSEMKNEIAYTTDMEVALKNHEFVVFMQPKVDLKTGKIRGAEALVRWRKNDGSIIYPNDFIPVFEKNKSVTTLDFYVYEEVFKYLRERIDKGLPMVPVSVNVSRIHLYGIDEIIDKIKGLLARYNVPAKYLEFELTETSFTDKVDDTITLMTRLRKLGVKVSLDDFGSGYSSLNVLTKLPLDVLKLDKEFMRDFENDSEEKIVIPSVIDMAKKLKLEVVCEGVETIEQVKFLKGVGCDMMQGYYFSKPISLDKFSEMLASDLIMKMD